MFPRKYHVKCKERKEQRDDERMWEDKVRKQRWAVVGNSFVKIKYSEPPLQKTPS